MATEGRSHRSSVVSSHRYLGAVEAGESRSPFATRAERSRREKEYSECLLQWLARVGRWCAAAGRSVRPGSGLGDHGRKSILVLCTSLRAPKVLTNKWITAGRSTFSLSATIVAPPHRYLIHMLQPFQSVGPAALGSCRL